MPRTRTLLAAATLCGVTLLPSVASADPVITAWSGGQPLGPSSQEGNDVTVLGADCVDPNGAPTFVGEVVSMIGDPATAADAFRPFETPTVDGSFEWSTVMDIGTLSEPVSLYARWYCSTTEAPALDDESVLWVSPVWDLTMSPAAPAGAAVEGLQARHAAGASTSTTSGPMTIALDVDADALPLVDRLGIHGEVAAELKARVDAQASDIATVHRLSMAYRGFGPTTAELELALGSGATPTEMAEALAGTPEFAARYGDMDDVRFVAALYQRVLGRPSDAAGRRFWAAQLAAGNVTRGRLVQAFADTPEGQAHTEDAGYVVAAHLVLGGRVPGRAALQPSIDSLAAGEVKVAVVEEIALRYKGANRWNSGR